jgi:hypothetical protein
MSFKEPPSKSRSCNGTVYDLAIGIQAVLASAVGRCSTSDCAASLPDCVNSRSSELSGLEHSPALGMSFGLPLSTDLHSSSAPTAYKTIIPHGLRALDAGYSTASPDDTDGAFQTIPASPRNIEAAFGRNDRGHRRNDIADTHTPSFSMIPPQFPEIYANGLADATSRNATWQCVSARPKFAAVEVLRPTAAAHDAPVFMSDCGVNATEDCATDHGLERAVPQESPSSTSPPAPSQDLGSVRCVKMARFKRGELNGMYVEHNVEGQVLGGRETYWSQAMKYFIYYSVVTNTWAIEKTKRFQSIKAQGQGGIVHSPIGFDLWTTPSDSGGARSNWIEWEPTAKRWVQCNGAGVQGRGRMRPAELAKATATVAAMTSPATSPATSHATTR